MRAVTRSDPRFSIPFGSLEIDENGIELMIPANATNIDITNDEKNVIVYLATDTPILNVTNDGEIGAFPLNFEEVYSLENGKNGNFITYISIKAAPNKFARIRWAFA